MEKTNQKDRYYEDNDKVFQKKKILIHKIQMEATPEETEKKAQTFLSQFGAVTDIRLLHSRKLKRSKTALSSCDLF